MPSAVLILIALIAGLAAGAAVTSAPALRPLADAIEPVGTIFINLIRMTVVPLVTASLIVAVASARDVRAIGRMGRRALALFIALLVAATAYSLLIGVPAFARLQIDPEAARALRESASGAGSVPASSPVPGLAQWVVDLVPVNPVRAAADAAMLPLIIFSLLFGLALNGVGEERRQAVVRFFAGVADAMFVLVRWVLAFAPLGVFALAVALAARLGLSVAGALAYYVGLVVVLMLAFTGLVLYPVAIVGGRMSLAQFAKGSAATQSVGFSSRSSLASLPAMIEGARSGFGSSEETVAFLLPLAASVFKVGSAIVQTTGVLFIARLYDVPLTTIQLLTVGATVVVTTFSAASVPGGSIIAMVPVLVAAGVPVQGLGLLLGVDTIPDMFRTLTNVTGSMAAAAVLGRTGSAAAREGVA